MICPKSGEAKAAPLPTALYYPTIPSDSGHVLFVYPDGLAAPEIPIRLIGKIHRPYCQSPLQHTDRELGDCGMAQTC